MSILLSPDAVRVPRLFLHFFDLHFLDDRTTAGNSERIYEECRLAARFAFLAAHEVLVPASSYFESEVCRRILDELGVTFPYGIIWIVGSGENIESFRYSKLEQYHAESSQYKSYSQGIGSLLLPPFKPRRGSATRDITVDWVQVLAIPKRMASLTTGLGIRVPKNFDRRWEKIPEHLEGRAFIVDYVEPLLFAGKGNPISRSRLHAIINESYFSSYVKEFSAGVVNDLVYLAAPYPIPSADANISYRALLNESRRLQLLQTISTSDGESLLRLRDDPVWLQCLSRTGQGNIVNSPDDRDAGAPIDLSRDRLALKCALTQGFDMGELKGLVFDLAIDWDEIAGQTKSERAMSLIEYASRQGKLTELATAIDRERPGLLDECRRGKQP